MKKVIDLWFKVKLLSDGVEPEYWVVNFPQLFMLLISLDDSDILEITPSKVGFKSE